MKRPKWWLALGEHLLRNIKGQAFETCRYQQTSESLSIIKIHIRSTLIRPWNKVWSANDDYLFLNLWWWWSASNHMRGVEKLPRSTKDWWRISTSDNTACPTFSKIFSKNDFQTPFPKTSSTWDTFPLESNFHSTNNGGENVQQRFVKPKCLNQSFIAITAEPNI